MSETVEIETVESLLRSVMYGLPHHPEFEKVFDMAFVLNEVFMSRGLNERCVVSAVPPNQISAHIGDFCVWDSELREYGEVPNFQTALDIYREHVGTLQALLNYKEAPGDT